jgi:tight adherence protein C
MDDPGSKGDSAAKEIMSKVAPLAMKPVMPKTDAEMSMISVRLSNAGYRDERAVSWFLASKTIAGLVLAGAAIGLTFNRGINTSTMIGITGIAGAIGFMLPKIWLWMACRTRAEQIRNGLPDSLDLMVISVEAGLGLDAAFVRVGEDMAKVHPALSEELVISTLETQMGLPRGESLSNLATRTGVAEVRSLVSVVSQAEKFGTSIARALRNQADALRIKRRQKAEERAQKTTVKLMVPLVLFIFPVIFLVLGGPAMMKLMATFKEMGY